MSKGCAATSHCTASSPAWREAPVTRLVGRGMDDDNTADFLELLPQLKVSHWFPYEPAAS